MSWAPGYLWQDVTVSRGLMDWTETFLIILNNGWNKGREWFKSLKGDIFNCTKGLTQQRIRMVHKDQKKTPDSCL